MTFVHDCPTFEFFRFITLSVKIIDQHGNINKLKKKPFTVTNVGLGNTLEIVNMSPAPTLVIPNVSPNITLVNVFFFFGKNYCYCFVGSIS
jgi:hypothetical protein